MTRASTKRARYWVLRYGSKPLWFLEDGEIGPRCTDRRGEAVRYPSKRKAMQGTAYSHALSDFRPEAVR